MKSLSKVQDLILSLTNTLNSNRYDLYQQINISKDQEQDLLNHLLDNSHWHYQTIDPNKLDLWSNKFLNIAIMMHHDYDLCDRSSKFYISYPSDEALEIFNLMN